MESSISSYSSDSTFNLASTPSSTEEVGDDSRFLKQFFINNSYVLELSSSQLDCVTKELLSFFTPEEVAAITSSGPLPTQVIFAVSALEECDSIAAVLQLGVLEGVIRNFGINPDSSECVISDIDEKEFVPILEILFSDGDDLEVSQLVESLLVDTRLLDSLVRCTLDAQLGSYQISSPMCAGLFDRVAKMMTGVVRQSIATDDASIINPTVLIELFSLSDEIFIWLADNVPENQQMDAIKVRDSSIHISKVMLESFEGLNTASNPEEVLEAMFAAVVRLDAERFTQKASVDEARKRLELFLVTTCGDGATYLFSILSNTGQQV